MTNRDEELEKIKKWRTELDQREAQLISAKNGAVDRTETDEEKAKVFNQLTPAERVDLYTNHPDRWQELLQATENEGWRRLLKW